MAKQGDRIAGSPVSARAAEEGHIFEWARADSGGRVELIPDQRSTLLRLTLDGDDPDFAMSKILERLSDALDAIEGVDRPSYKLDPDAGAAPDEATSGDQPL
jgi:hypothetical protein